MKIIREANELYNNRDYEKALLLYESAADIYGYNFLKLNIQLCEKKLLENDEYYPYYMNNYFDNIYLVNLPKDKERLFSSVSRLNKAGITYEVFEAVNGYTDENKKYFKEYNSNIGKLVRYKDFNEKELKRGKRFIESPGAIGYLKTYIRILQDAQEKKYKRILILEDDIIFRSNFHIWFKSFISSIENDWKILQLGASQYNWNSVDLRKATEIGYYYPRQLDTCGSFAIGIDSSIFSELIEIQSCFESPFDHLTLGEIYEKYYGKCFVCYPNAVMPDVASSTIRDGRSQEKHSKRMKWDLSQFLYPRNKYSLNIIVQSKKNLTYVSRFDFDALPFDLNFFYFGSDGYRPIHNFESSLHRLPETPIVSSNLLDGDITLSVVDPSYILTESDLIYYVTNIVVNGNVENPNFKLISKNVDKTVKGRVSIIIPTYKRPQNLWKALESVVIQDYNDKEIIIISDNDDGSNYNLETEAIIASFQDQYPSSNIVFHKHKKNRNGASARNTGIFMSTGEYICFLDDDDMYLEGRISESVKVLEKHKHDNSIGAVYCGFLGWNSPVDNLNRYKEGDLTKELLLLDYEKHYLHTNTATYKRSAIIRLNGFDESYKRHQDLEFNLRFFRKYLVKSVKKVGVKLNPEPSNISNKVYNLDMLFLKKKFLKQFGYIIDEYSKEIQCDIYNKHWLETKKYISDEEKFNSYLLSDMKNAEFQIYSLLSH